MKLVYGESNKKCFLNVCHCEELPPPTDDIDEDQLAARIDKGDVGYRIPVSIGELDSVVDNKNENQPKIDVLVNSVFYEKRLAPPAAEFFRHFFCMVVCGAVEEKHHIKLNPNKCVKLKNRVVMGSIEPMRISKRPLVPVIQELQSDSAPKETPVIHCDFKNLRLCPTRCKNGINCTFRGLNKLALARSIIRVYLFIYSHSLFIRFEASTKQVLVN
ncbi:unnamed protein product [Heligmosomoides polygyrus]|uniref:PIH1 domain-containing protein n=1 Tax=Heligmosomoides polygyrus TaxID=6339 RepID=A0A3P8C5X8_HELPZ|nr:unnamed protein product [Heligmosomoides polygyrus]